MSEQQSTDIIWGSQCLVLDGIDGHCQTVVAGRGSTERSPRVSTIFILGVENFDKWTDTERDSRTCLARSNSQARTGTGNIRLLLHFPCSAGRKEGRQPGVLSYPVGALSTRSGGHSHTICGVRLKHSLPCLANNHRCIVLLGKSIRCIFLEFKTIYCNNSKSLCRPAWSSHSSYSYCCRML